MKYYDQKEDNKPIKNIIRNFTYSFLAQILPLLSSIVLIPHLIKGLGAERFGLLTLGWVFLGYFSLFDLGLGRATTKFVAEYRGKGDNDKIPSLVWTSWFLLFILGILASIILFILMSWLIKDIFNIPTELIGEAQRGFGWVAVSIPFVIYTTGIRGVLEAYHRFKLIALITSPAGLLNYLIPVLALLVTHQLDIILFLLLINRIIFSLIYLLFCLHSVPEIGIPQRPNLQLFKPLIQFGGWLTVTNIVGPLMTYLDRFLVGSIVSVTAVAYYVTPYEMLNRIQVLANSLMSVLFPTFSSLQSVDQEHSTHLFHRAVSILFLFMLPITIVLIVIGKELLNIWISAEFAQNSTPILQWLAIGMLINTIAKVAYSWIQANGQADITAKFHLAEFPVYIVLILVFAQIWGTVGVAIAWVIRVSLDAVLLFWYTRKSLAPTNNLYTYLIPNSLLALGLYFCMFLLISQSHNLVSQIAIMLGVLAAYGIVVWYIFLESNERNLIITTLLPIRLSGPT